MEEHIKSPIEMMAELLAEMTTRAVEAERERDAAKLDAENWYQAYTRRDEQLEECRKQLETEKAQHVKTEANFKKMETAYREEAEAHLKTHEKLKEYIANLEKGASENE